MKSGTVTFLRLVAGAAALGFLCVMPLTDRFFGGNVVRIASGTPGSAGDADGNGTVDMLDVQVIRDIYNGLTNPDDNTRNAADINHDGQINSDDAGILLRYLAEPDAPSVSPDVYYQQLQEKGAAE